MSNPITRSRESPTRIDSTERPEIHTNGGTFLIYADGHVLTVTNERYEQARRALARCAFEDPKPEARTQAEAIFRRVEEDCFREFGLIRHGSEWVFADFS